jgi:DtxR family Mn-dependent transcriptional regulator
VATANPVLLSSAVEDYLKAVYVLESEGERATTSALAERMRVSAPSVTAMMKRLAALGLVERAPYRGVVLTDSGRLTALEVLRHHRLLERYFVDVLGLALDQVHAEADALEHVLSEELEQRIDAALGFPRVDPHGDPIPDANLAIVAQPARTVAQLAPGESAVVVRIPDRDPELVRYLVELSLAPGDTVALKEIGPFGGPATIETRSGQHAIGRELAAAVEVT